MNNIVRSRRYSRRTVLKVNPGEAAGILEGFSFSGADALRGEKTDILTLWTFTIARGLLLSLMYSQTGLAITESSTEDFQVQFKLGTREFIVIFDEIETDTIQPHLVVVKAEEGVEKRLKHG